MQKTTKPKEMTKLMLSIAALAALSASAWFTLGPVQVFAQSTPDITGTWQGTLQIPQANRELRTVVKILKDGGNLKGMFYSIDQQGPGIAIGTITVQGSTVKMTIPGIGGSYEGKLDSDGVNLTGTFTQGAPLPLNLKHVTDAMAWEIPKPPPPPAKMPADANPSFEVATIKPTKPGTGGKIITMRDPRTFVTVNFTFNDLMVWGYGLHPRQVSGGPAWLGSDGYDIQATPEPQGMPSRQQLETMIQKLLADRFKLTFHHEKKELSVFALTVGKGGPKLTASTGDPNGLPGFGAGFGTLNLRNANMFDFTRFMQSSVLDRPVVDQTGLVGRFDFQLKWTPDETQFGGQGGRGPAPDEKADAPPDLFTAIQQQLGLKLESTKTPVDVLVIDHVERPSEN